MRTFKSYIFLFFISCLLAACGSQKNLIISSNDPDIIPSHTYPQAIPVTSYPAIAFPSHPESASLDYVMDYGLIEQSLGINIDAGDNLLLLRELASWVGVPYKHANNDKSGTDCSGLSFAVFRKLYNKSLERTSDGQFFKNCVKVNKKSLRQGDLLFFAINDKRKISHVGIYLKNDKFIHASSIRGVVVSDLNDDYYRKSFYAAGRVR